MNIEILARDFKLTDALRAYVERRLNFTFSGRFEQIKSIQVRLSDINGPRGGIDKRCRIQITVPRLKDIVVEDTESNLYMAIDRATDRAGRTVNRRLSRQFYKNRKLFVPNKRTPDLGKNGQYA